ncbi:MAG: ABC transporter ATP-binding protein [Meiothermus silvanus]|nr:ABC transporter ATP-binding protein [Allomeiothermus silvanus]
MPHLLEIQELVCGYGDADILHGVSLYVNEGEVVTIIGPNGAGKSTVLKAVMGLLKVRGGDIRFYGASLLGQPTELLIDQGIAYVPQVNNVFPSLTVYENLLLFGRKMRGDIKAQFGRVLNMFPTLKPKLSMRAGLLSGGERQMLAFARALVTAPALILLDEPTAALSPLLAKQIFQKILDIRVGGTAILLVEQNVRRALEISDRAYVLDTGRNALSGSGQDLLAHPAMGELYLGGTVHSV